MAFTSKKRDIAYLTFDPSDGEALAANSLWILPQIDALLNRLPLVKSDLLISPSLTLQAWKFATEGQNPVTLVTAWGQEEEKQPNIWLSKILAWLNTRNRGDILGKASQTSNPRYAANVPLILAAFKEYRGIKYSDWDWSDPKISWFLGSTIYDCIMFLRHPEIQIAEPDLLVQLREEARVVRTGQRMGTHRQLKAYLPLRARLKDMVADWDTEKFPSITDIPQLVPYLLTQSWIYHPSVRHKLAITDVFNLDEPATPLLDGEIFIEEKPKLSAAEELPW